MIKHSEKFNDVYYYYKHNLWTKDMIKNAINRWITEKEYEEIIKEGDNIG